MSSAAEHALPPGALARAVAAIDAGSTYKAALEALLLELPPGDADWLMQILRESRGAFAPLARAGPGRALFLGDPLSGTSVALGRLGFETTTLGRDGERLEFAAHRARALVETPAHFVLAGGGARLPFAPLPFADGAFDLVVQEGGLPGPATGAGHDLGECARVARGELVLVADNRFGYKRSAGAHGAFHVLGPLEYTGAIAAPRRGQKSLWGYRRALAAAGLGDQEAYSLYPHSGQFVHVVALDRPRPRLPVGPKERENRLKILGARLGLFPVLTPSFAFVAARGPRSPGDPHARARRIERILAELGRELGEGPAEVDQLVATRGNTAVILTRASGTGDGADEGDRAGRWCLHLPLSPCQQRLTELHAEALSRLARERSRVPVPELLFAGRIEGVYLTCERRLGGHTAPELSDAAPIAEALLVDAARIAPELARGPARALGEDEFEELVGSKCDLVLRFAAVPETLAIVRDLRVRAKSELVGRAFPRVLYHADLRGKHVQIDRSGRVLGILDWGTYEDPGPALRRSPALDGARAQAGRGAHGRRCLAAGHRPGASAARARGPRALRGGPRPRRDVPRAGGSALPRARRRHGRAQLGLQPAALGAHAVRALDRRCGNRTTRGRGAERQASGQLPA